MKKIFPLLYLILISFNLYSNDLININFTRDSTYWLGKFPALAWNTAGTDFIVSGLDNFAIENYRFKGSFGKFNPGSGVYAQPIHSEDNCIQHIYAFRLGNTGNSYITFPELPNAGRLTLHCKSGNSTENAVFYIEQLTDGKWERIRTMVAPPHGNKDVDVVLKQNLNIDKPVTLRMFGASKNLHVYNIKLEEFDPQLAKEKPLRLIVLPDTQHYTRDNPLIFQSQTAWIANNADSISFAIHVGDITNANNTTQWPKAAYALSIMDGNVPYTFTPGNHDMGGNNAQTRNTSLLNQYMPFSKYSKMPGFGGIFEEGKMDNSWHTFTTPDGYQFIIISIEFAPRNAVLEWAGQIVKSHPSHNIIINTHAYMYSDEKRHSDRHEHKWTPSTYGLFAESNGDANDGEEMWEKLVKLYPNIFMVVSGHVLNDGIGTLVSEGDKGNKVYQMLANYQDGVIGTSNGGNGFLRVIDIDTKQSVMKIRTYSPYADEYKTEADQEFSFEGVNLIKAEALSTSNFKKNKISVWTYGNEVFLENQTGISTTIRIYDLLGCEKYYNTDIQERTSMGLDNGYYILVATNEELQIKKKIIIK